MESKEDREILLAVEHLRRGGVVALPTETVYGLAANALDQKAVEKIFQIKKRPLNDPLILHVASAGWLERYTETNFFSKRIEKITKKFWPGPVTIILPKKNIIPDVVTADFPTVAVRCPAHEIFQKILQLTDLPLAAPSANPFGYVTPTTADQVKKTLGEDVEIILDGGPCAVGLESTIIDLTKELPKILRPGAITADEISRALGEEVADYSASIVAKNPNCPGQLKQHYCTNTRLKLFAHKTQNFPEVSPNSAIIFTQKPKNLKKFAEKIKIAEKNIFWLSDDGDEKIIAKNLFSLLQELDRAKFDEIFCERPEISGIGIAINDRLSRAAAKFQF